MKTAKYILFFLTIPFMGCNSVSNKTNTIETASLPESISIDEIKTQLGNKYDISVDAIKANHGSVFAPVALDTMIMAKFMLEDIKNKKTLGREIESNPFDIRLVDQYHFESLPSYTSHFLNYEITCDAPLIRIAAKVNEGCTLFMVTKDETTDYMVSLPLFKEINIKGYFGQVTSEIDGCNVKRTIKETFGTSSSYEVNGVNILPKRRIEQAFKIESNGQVKLLDEQEHLTNMKYFEAG